MTETVESTAASPAGKIEAGEWQAFLSDPCGDIVTDPDEIAELLAEDDPKGRITVCRGSAGPNEHGRLSGTYLCSDMFVEIDLEDVELEQIGATWKLAQKAAWGMNQDSKAQRRVWFAGDPEPAVGTRVLVAGSVWVRHHQLRWILWPGGNGCPGLDWSRLVGSEGFPVVEVLPHEEVEKYGGLVRKVNAKADQVSAPVRPEPAKAEEETPHDHSR